MTSDNVSMFFPLSALWVNGVKRQNFISQGQKYKVPYDFEYYYLNALSTNKERNNCGENKAEGNNNNNNNNNNNSIVVVYMGQTANR